MPLLEARRLVKRFAAGAVVRDVSFTLRAGQVLGYLGPNGSGKSTTVKMLVGLVPPSSGDILFDGRDVQADMVGFRRRLGYVPEEAHLYVFQSGRECLELVGRLREMSERTLQVRIAALLELFGLTDAAEVAISAYSKGMRQKLLICAALLHNPDVLLLDEPESGLDVSAALTLRHLVHELARRGKAILYSSHVLDVVERVCASVVILHEGQVVAHDEVSRLRELQQSPSLEHVFARLVLRADPARLAQDIADVMAAGS